MFGLDDKTLEEMRGVLKRHASVETAKIFGSRALGTHRPNSDIDLALCGSLDIALVGRIQSDLDEMPTPYKFDVVAYGLIEHQKLKEHIDRFGQVFYKKQSD